MYLILVFGIVIFRGRGMFLFLEYWVIGFYFFVGIVNVIVIELSFLFNFKVGLLDRKFFVYVGFFDGLGIL